MKHILYKDQVYHKRNEMIHMHLDKKVLTYINGFEFPCHATSSDSKIRPQKSRFVRQIWDKIAYCEMNNFKEVRDFFFWEEDLKSLKSQVKLTAAVHLSLD